MAPVSGMTRDLLARHLSNLWFIFRKLSVRWPVVMIKNLEDFHRILHFIILHMHTDKFLRVWPIYIYTFFGQLIRRCFEIESNIRSTSCFDRCHGGGLFTFVMWKECWVYLFTSKHCTTILGKIRVKNIFHILCPWTMLAPESSTKVIFIRFKKLISLKSQNWDRI